MEKMNTDTFLWFHVGKLWYISQSRVQLVLKPSLKSFVSVSVFKTLYETVVER